MNRRTLLGAVAIALAAPNFCCTSVDAQTFPPTVVKRNGYTLKARAYIDPSRLPSRYDLRLFQPKSTPYRWDFVIPGSNFPRTQARASVGTSDYRTQKQATIRATLRQYDTYTEKVTFKNLDLSPLRPGDSNFRIGPSRALSIPKSLSITTPSGISVILPAQSYDAIPPFMAGNPNALFIRIEVKPNAKLISSLPDSPLFRKHRRPVSLQLGVPQFVYQREDIYYTDDATPNYGRVALSVPNLNTVMHLNELTFYIRQRTNLQIVPVALKVPIAKPMSQAPKP